jgi:hypothetical protein
MFSVNEERALDLLSNDIEPSIVASALGITPGAISQFCAKEEFARELANRRYEKLQLRATLDIKADSIQGKLLETIEEDINSGMDMLSPMQKYKALQVVSGIKRNNIPLNQQIDQEAKVIHLTLPLALVQRFEVNINNQVVKAGEQSLVTINSSKMAELAGGTEDAKLLNQ